MMVSGLDGDIQTGCGIMVMDMAMFGVMAIITFGQDLTLILMVFMIRLILSGVIMIPFIMDTDMVMAILMVIILGGDHIILGIITIPMEEI